MAQRIAIAGDWHGDQRWSDLLISSLPDDIDFLIHLGDFGYMGNNGRDFAHAVTMACADKGIYLLVIPGNHENYDWIEQLPFDDEGRLTLSDRIRLAPRGYRFELAGTTFCCAGGAVSVDRARRTEGATWWPQEALTTAEVESISAGEPVDVLLTHDGPLGADPPALPHDTFVQIFGQAIATKAMAHHKLIRDISDALTPHHLLHGHFHERYTREVEWESAQGAGTYRCQIDGLGAEWDRGNTVIATVEDGRLTLEKFVPPGA